MTFNIFTTANCAGTRDGSLAADEVYALTAFILYRNGVIKQTDLLDASSLPKVRMPKVL